MLPDPRATVRLQLNRDFPFAAAAEQVDYYRRLGISHYYLSPILTARRGSTHGYDVVDPHAVNPELGGEDGLRALVERLRAHDMGLVVDIVPNHMAVGGDQNRAWLDLLEWGPDSRFATLFDVDWNVPDPALNRRLLAPFLGRPYGEVLADGELALQFDRQRGRFHVEYFEHHFPLSPASVAWLLQQGGPALSDLAARFRAAARVSLGRRGDAFEQACHALVDAGADAPDVRTALDTLLARIAGDRALLHRLLERQHWRLAWWRTAPDEINWRRFFDIIDLAGTRVQEPAAFEWLHATVFRLYGEGLIDGVRVDHVDGLADPRTYCRRLRQRLERLCRERPDGTRTRPWLIVEKILAPGEPLPADWQVDGTTGYSFMNEVGGLLHDPAGEAPLEAIWRSIAGPSGDYGAQERDARRRIPQALLASDFNACALALHAIARSEPQTRDWTLAAIRRVLAELLVVLPVYRTYADARGRSASDRAVMAQAVAAARPQLRPAERPLLDLVDRWLGGEPPRRLRSVRARRARLRAIGRFQQLSSPVAAKAVEDTVFYRHGRLLSRNEVGANPAQFALSPDDFHAEMQRRAQRLPRAMLTTATHDHKRGEDVRARLAVLSEQPALWATALTDWQTADTPFERGGAPDAIDASMLYQMLLGALPPALAADDRAGLAAFAERIAGWQTKALRESKRHSSWAEPDADYEQAAERLLHQRLASPAFVAQLFALRDRLAPAAAANGLAQLLIRCTAPGVCDLYQGGERWDLSLVDPDNRRPVDYRERRAALGTAPLAALADWRDGRLKQAVLERALALRAALPEVFVGGSYRPLRASGAQAGHLFAFARSAGDDLVLVLTTRLSSALVEADAPSIAAERWHDTTLRLPRPWQRRAWHDLLTDRTLPAAPALPAAELLGPLPVALLRAQH